MIRILYDHQMLSIQKYGGISRYFSNLNTAFERDEEIQSKISLFYSRNHYLKNAQPLLNNLTGRLLLKSDKKLYKWNQKFSLHEIRKNQFDIFHPTYYNPYFLPALKKPFVLTVHDMIYELFPEFFPNDIYIEPKKKLIEQADQIIAISQSAKNDIKDILKIPDDKITVVHHGFFPTKFDVNFQPPYRKYFLFVGDRAAYKNFSRFIEASQPVLEKDQTINIVCTGGGAFNLTESKLFKRYGIEDRITQLSVSDEQLMQLYKKAVAFIFPSLYEGFGFPLLEAFDNNCPVLASDTSCFKEVAGDAAIYFNPYNINEITLSMKKIISEPLIAGDLRSKGKQRLNFFSMEKCVQETKEVYQMVFNQRR